MITAIALAFLLGAAAADVTAGVEKQTVVIESSDGAHIVADLWPASERAVILAHGGRFTRKSWAHQAEQLSAAGFTVLALDFRGYGESRLPADAEGASAAVHLDVLAAAHFLRERGATNVYAVGASFGGTAVADAAIVAGPGTFDRIVVLAAPVSERPEKLEGRKLLIIARDDIRGGRFLRLPEIREQYELMPEPKELVILDGSAHAQFLFESDQSERLMQEILRFLSAP